MKRDPQYKKRSVPVIEALEPRILFSVDALGGAVDNLASDEINTLLDDTAAALEQQRSTSQTPNDEETAPLPESGDTDESDGQVPELVFVDTRSPDYLQLVDDLAADEHRNFEVILIDAQDDGLQIISDTLASYQDIEAIHLISHGSAGQITLGAEAIDASTLVEQSETFIAWSEALSADADLLIYGCDLASTAAGEHFVDTLARLTDADVAASDDRTGNQLLGGDWNLEYTFGEVETRLAVSEHVQQQWGGTLADVIVESYQPTPAQMDDNAYEVKVGQTFGQTFSFISGSGTYEVNEIDLVLYKESDATAGQVFTISLRDAWNGNILGVTDTISSDDLTTTEDWHNFDIGSVLLNDGTTYVIQIDTVNGSDKVYLGVDKASTYANGDLLDKDGAVMSGEDAAFRIIQNTPPVPQNDSYTINEDTTLNANVLVNDSDPESDTLTVNTTPVVDVSNGALTLNADGSFTYIPNANFNGSDSFVYEVDDGSNNQAQATVTITVDPVNDAPLATNLSAPETYTEDTPLNLTDIVVTDVDDYITVTLTLSDDTAGILNTATSGSVTSTFSNGVWTASGAVADVNALLAGLTFTPSLNYNSNFTIATRVDDGVAPALTGSKVMTGIAVNDAPIAQSDSYTIDEDTTLTSNDAWFDNGWQYRRTLSFDNLAQTENLTDFPILIALDSNRIDYGSTQPGGADLRFTDSDGTVLAHEIESWNVSGTSYVWVKVPQIDGSSDSDYIWMYYGNNGAADGQNSSDVWSAGYQAVYHLDETGTTFNDSTSLHVDGTTVNGTVSVTGQIGAARDFDGVDDAIDLGADQNFLNSASIATLSAWVNADNSTGDNAIVGVTIDGTATTSSSRFGILLQDGNVHAIVRSTDDTSDTALVTTVNTFTDNNWHLVHVIADYANDTVTIYVDGVAQATTGTVNFTNTATPNTNSENAAIGANEGSGGGSEQFDGTIDEARIANVGRSADWIKAEYESQRDNFVTFGYQQSIAGVLGNDIDAEGDGLTATLVSGTSNGVLTFNADGSFVYTPDANFNGTDSFTYEVDDGNGSTDQTTVTITVNPINDAPIGTDNTITMDENTTYVFTPADFGFTDVDTGDSLLKIRIDSINISGSDNLDLTGSGGNDDVAVGQEISFDDINNGLLVFTPGNNASGTAYADFTFTVFDQADASDSTPRTMTIDVIEINDPPTISGTVAGQAVDDIATILPFAAVTIGDTDTPPDTLSVTVSLDTADKGIFTADSLTASGFVDAGGGNYTFSGNSNSATNAIRQLVFDPADNRVAPGSTETTIFTITVDDGLAAPVIDNTTTVVSTSINDVPTDLTLDNATVAENAAGAVIGNVSVTDPDVGDTYSYTVDDPRFEVVGGQLKLVAGQSLDFETESTVNLTIMVTDLGGSGLSYAEAFLITVTDVNDVPILTGDLSANVDEGDSYTLTAADLGYSDQDDNDAGVTFTVSNQVNGTVWVNGAASTSFTGTQLTAGQVSFVHDDSETVTASFDVNVEDGDEDSSTPVNSTFTFNVNPVNDAPSATNDPGDYNTNLIALNPLSYWRFGETSGGTAADDGSGAHDATYNGVTLGQNGAIDGDSNTAVSFDGGNDYIQIDHHDDFLLASGTVQLWFNADDLSTDQALFSKDSTNFDTGGHFTIRLLTDGSIEVRLQSTTDSYYIYSAAGSVTAGSWHHVAVTFGTDGMELFLDGVSVGANAYTGGLGGNYNSIAIGANTWVSEPGPTWESQLTDYFGGSIDEVAILDQVVTAEEIQNLYYSAIQNYTINEDTSLVVPASEGVLINDTDVEDDALTAILVSGPSNAASFTLNADGSFNYTPVANFSGTDTFTYTANDGSLDSNVATVTITVIGDNDAPVNTVPGTQTVLEDTQTAIPGISVTDPDAGSGIITTQLTVTNGVLEVTLDGAATISAGANGSSTLTISGTVTDINNTLASLLYTGNLNVNGVAADTLTVVTNDQGNTGTGGALSDTDSVQINITPVNDAPVADDELGLTTAEDTLLNIDVLTGDTDVDGDPLSVTEVNGTPIAVGGTVAVTNGSVTLLADGTLDFTPALNYNGPVNFTYTVSDGVLSDTGNVAITVTPVNDAPTDLAVDNLTVAENSAGAVIGNVTVTDPDAGDTHTYTVDDARFEVVGGQLKLVAGQSLDYETDPTVTVTITATDAGGLTYNEAFTITVTNVNEVPTAIALSNNSIDENVAVGTTVGTLTSTDPDSGNTFTYTLVAGAGDTDNAVFTIVGDQLQINASPDFETQSSYDIRVRTTDQGGLSTEQTFTITVTDINDAPLITSAGAVSVTENQTAVLTVTYSDEDVPADTILYSIVGGADGGLFNIDASGNLSFITAPDYENPADADLNNDYVVQVQVNDQQGGTATQTITVTVINVNEAPTDIALSNSSLTENTDTTGGVLVGNLSATDEDAGDTFAYAVVGGADQAVFSISGNQLLIDDGVLDFETQNSYVVDIEVTDQGGTGLTFTETFTITVINVNEAPVADDELGLTTAEDTLLNIDVLAGDTDVDGDPLTVTQINGTATAVGGTVAVTNGSVTLLADGTLDFTPAVNYNGPVNFTYTVSDGALTDIGNVTITVTPVNDAPVANDDTATVAEGNAVIINLVGNDTDADNALDLSTITIIGAPADGVLVDNGDGTLTYTHDGSETLADSFSYTIDDVSGATSNVANVAITVTPVNDAPVVSDAGGTLPYTEGDGAQVIDGALTITDVDDANIESATVTLSGGYINGEDVLSFTNTPNITGSFDAVTGVLTLTGTDTLANYELALESVTYTNTNTDNPDTGNRTVSWVINDGNTNSAGVTSTITVTGVNDAPVADDELGLTTAEDTLLNIDVLTGDFDADGDALSVTQINGTAIAVGGTVAVTNGSVTLLADGTLDFTPALNYNGAVSFNYTVSDGALTDTGNVAITVTAVNDVPVATANTVTTTEDNAFNFASTDFTFSDVEGDSLVSATITNLSLAGGTLTHSGGTVVNSGDTLTAAQLNTLVYTPAANANGAPLATFDFTVNDSGLGTVAAQMDIDVTAVNDAPVANDDTYSTNEDTVLTTVLGVNDLLQNDSDVEGDTLTVNTTPLVDVINGTLVLNANGTFTYTPNANFNGMDSFTYEVSDGNGGTAQASVTITVNAVDDVPTTSPVTLTAIAEDSGPRLITQAELLSNANDIDGDPLTATDLTISAGAGNLIDNLDGTWTYTPAANDNTSVSFVYTITDTINTVTGTATLDITPVNDAPVAVDDGVSTAEDTPLIITVATNLLGNDSDVDGDTISIIGFTQPANGTVVDNLDGTFTYTPDANFNGADTFSYSISDGNGGTDTANVTVTVGAVNDAPTTSAVTLTAIAEDSGPRLITQAELLSNANDIDGDPLTATDLTISAGAGNLIDNLNGTWTYTPAVNDNTSVSFVYTITDSMNTVPGEAALDITPVNDAPVAIDDGLSTNEDTPLTFDTATSLLGNDNDVDGDALSINTFTQPANGTVVDNLDGTFTYIPDTNFNGTDSFTYEVSDGNGGTDTATVTIMVSAVNDAPVISAIGNRSVDELATLSFTVTASDAELPAQNLTYSLDSSSIAAGMTINANTGLFGWTPTAVQDGLHTVTVTVTDDGTGNLSDSETFTITVNSVTGIEPPLPDPGTDSDNVISDEDMVDPVQDETEESEEKNDRNDTTSGGVGNPAEDDSVLTKMLQEMISNIILDAARQENGLDNNENDKDKVVPPKFIDLKNLDIAPYESQGANDMELSPLDNRDFVRDLDELGRDMADAMGDEKSRYRLAADTAIGLTMSLSVGIISWLLRTGTLLATFMSVIPFWKQFDLVPVLAKRRKELDEQEEGDIKDSSVEDVFNKNNASQ